MIKIKLDKILKVTSHYLLLIIILSTMFLFYWGFTTHRMWTIIIVGCIVLILWLLEWTRTFAFSIDRVFKNVNETFWDFMMHINVFINKAFIRYTLATILLIVFLICAKNMLSLIF